MEKNREEQLKLSIIKARNELDAIEVERHVKENKSKIGKCFKYSNSYGSGNRWWLYGQVIGIDKRGACLTWSFQCTSHGEFQVQKKEWGDWITKNNGYIPITKSEFKKAWKHHLVGTEKYGESIQFTVKEKTK
jgi:hypothetical protein